MELKKNPKYNLENKRGMFFNIGLLISITLVTVAFEWKTEEKGIEITEWYIDPEDLIDIKATIQPVPPKPKVIMPVVKEVPADEDIEDQDYEIDNVFSDTTGIAELSIPEPTEDGGDIVTGPIFVVEDMPEPIGGTGAFYSYVSRKLKYPRVAKKMGISGKVIVTFVVDEEGELTDIKVLKGIGGGCDEEAVRVFKKAAKWKPGKQRGRPVKVNMAMPIFFQLH